MSTHLAIAAAIALGCAAPFGRSAAPCGTDATLVLRGLDPVELVDGREVEGAEELAADHGGFRYRFISEDTRELFLADPERYGVQWDGACGRMGPLSGIGDADRFAVWNERIWLFASDQCRTGFLKAPEKLQPIDEAPPAADDAAKAAGQALLEQAAAALGDLQALDQLKGVQIHQLLKTTSAGTDWHGTRDVWFAFPDSYRFEEAWSGKGYGHAIAGTTATRFEPNARQVLGKVSTTAVQREAARHPLWIVKNRRQLLAVPAGQDTVLGQPALLVTVHHAGQNVTLALDAKSSRVVELRHTGLASRGVAPVVRRVTAWQPVGKLRLPARIQTVGVDGVVDDTVVGCESTSGTSVTTDPAFEAGHFGGR